MQSEILSKYSSYQNQDKTIKKLKISYVIALSLVALIALVSQLIIRNALQNQENDANIVNVSGRQRLLSQQIAKNSSLLIFFETKAELQKCIDELKSGVDKFETQYKGLINGNPDLKLSGNNSPKILKMFGDLDQYYTPILKTTKEIIKPENRENQLRLKNLVKIILENEKPFLKGMNEIVDRFALEAKQKINNLKNIELILMFITFITLFAEAFLIFRPVFKKVIFYIDDLRATYEEVLALSEELRQINEELFANNDALEQSKHLIEKQKKDIEINSQNVMDSINYAQRIQSAIMVEQSNVIKNFKSAFILNIPKDVVSGDFYWFGKVQKLKIVILSDCTGHGVGGAFMTMIGVTLLNEIINVHQTTNPKDILDDLDILLKATLQHHQKIKDGMDIAVVMIDEEQKKLYFAGARQNLYYNRKGEILELKGARNSIDGIILVNNPFVTHIIDIEQNDVFYLTSDGYRDQFGGEEKRKYMSSQFKELLKNMDNLPLLAQRDKLEAEHYRWKGTTEQTDDILVIGFQIF
ncbi:MAG: hypothetical protein EAZ85_16210 [Bacteroidetes bacterium]|nr:MAG: hypothetical protein EAZ85_16210 [Bacteroidota bacterium]TAG95861.1 MAG: hypothetical protein EAZ20_00060 [Bacteroidota bacterium]